MNPKLILPTTQELNGLKNIDIILNNYTSMDLDHLSWLIYLCPNTTFNLFIEYPQDLKLIQYFKNVNIQELRI